jgi:ADP-ribose pyrophosphatase YjhB (NUDIX family)
VIKLPIKVMQSYWRHTRGLTLGAQAAVIDGQGRFLLVRHGYRPGWHFPGGGVERGEAIGWAMARELMEEAGVEVQGTPQLFGLYDNGAHFPGDHIALFVVKDWRQPVVPKPTAEIRAQGFYEASALPDNIAEGTRRRITEIAAGGPPSPVW